MIVRAGWQVHVEGPRDKCVAAIEQCVDIPQCLKEGLVKTVRALPDKTYYVSSQGHRDDQHGDLSLTVMQTRG